MKRNTLDTLREICRKRRRVVLVTELATGSQHMREPQDLSDDATGVMGSGKDEVFVHLFMPPPRLIVVGAVHIAQKLIPIAELAGFSVSVVDPRAAFAAPERFPGVELIRQWPDRALALLRLDSETAVVALSHDPKLDDPALVSALGSPAFYIGALGSRKTQAKRLERLRAAGFNEPDLERIRGPVGLPIGAVSPGEIGIAIMAEIVAAHHGRMLQPVNE